MGRLPNCGFDARLVVEFICKKFRGYVLDSNYERDYNKVTALELVGFDRETTRAIGQAKLGIGVDKK